MSFDVSGKVHHRRGAPADPFSATCDAALLYLAMVKLGYPTRYAKEWASLASGVNQTNIEKYAREKREEWPEALVLDMARAALYSRGWHKRVSNDKGIPPELKR